MFKLAKKLHKRLAKPALKSPTAIGNPIERDQKIQPNTHTHTQTSKNDEREYTNCRGEILRKLLTVWNETKKKTAFSYTRVTNQQYLERVIIINTSTTILSWTHNHFTITLKSSLKSRKNKIKSGNLNIFPGFVRWGVGRNSKLLWIRFRDFEVFNQNCFIVKMSPVVDTVAYLIIHAPASGASSGSHLMLEQYHFSRHFCMAFFAFEYDEFSLNNAK